MKKILVVGGRDSSARRALAEKLMKADIDAVVVDENYRRHADVVMKVQTLNDHMFHDGEKGFDERKSGKRRTKKEWE